MTNFRHRLIILVSALMFIVEVQASVRLLNYTERNEIQSSRHSRYLIYNYGGTTKMAYGAIFPLYLMDKVKWRQVNCVNNLQAAYSNAAEPIYWWDKWEGRSLKAMREQFDKYGKYVRDESRLFIYAALETLMNRQGKNGRKCLCRSICENAQIDHHEGILSEMLNAVLLPGKELADEEYQDAYEAGRAGIDCESMYPECPRGQCIFDSVDVTYSNFI